MADIITTQDLSVEDTSKLKTEDTKRRYDMPKACVDRLIKDGHSPEAAHKLCYPKGKKYAKSGNSPKSAGKSKPKSSSY